MIFFFPGICCVGTVFSTEEKQRTVSRLDERCMWSKYQAVKWLLSVFVRLVWWVFVNTHDEACSFIHNRIYIVWSNMSQSILLAIHLHLFYTSYKTSFFFVCLLVRLAVKGWEVSVSNLLTKSMVFREIDVSRSLCDI